MPGLDYIGHEDVMPYTAVNKKPIRHDLFDKFLVYSADKGIFFTAFHWPLKYILYSHVFSNWLIAYRNTANLTQPISPDPPFCARDTLTAWQERNHPWLELSDVHKETTENIRVTVIPFYMGCRESQNANVYWVSFVLWLYSEPNFLCRTHLT